MSAVLFEWHGLASFTITVKFEVGEVKILTDPFGPETGLKFPRAISADIVTVGNPEDKKQIPELVGGSPFIVSSPGEYEVKGVFIYGLAARSGAAGEKKKAAARNVWRIETGELAIAHLGGIWEPPDDSVVDELSDIDVLILPVGGGALTLTAGAAADLMTRLEPRVVIPCYFRLPGLKFPLDPVEKFVKEAGLSPERLSRLKLAKKDLPAEETKLVVLNP